jgi:hypothetical protein
VILPYLAERRRMTTAPTAEIVPPRTLTEIEEEAIAAKPITWGQFTFLMDYVARQSGDKAMRFLSRMCGEIIFVAPLQDNTLRG